MSEQVTFRKILVVLGRALLAGGLCFVVLFLVRGKSEEAFMHAYWYAGGALLYGIVFGLLQKRVK